MARSAYIYYFQDLWTHRLIAAFTVKREALNWAERHFFSPNDIALYRIPDGREGEKIPTKEFNIHHDSL